MNLRNLPKCQLRVTGGQDRVENRHFVNPSVQVGSLKYCYIAGGVGGADTVDRADIKAPDESPVLPEPKG